MALSDRHPGRGDPDACSDTFTVRDPAPMLAEDTEAVRDNTALLLESWVWRRRIPGKPEFGVHPHGPQARFAKAGHYPVEQN